jgi:hypothetical protein
MTFNPDPVSVTAKAGVSTQFTISATPQTPEEFAGASTLYAYIVDPNHVISTTLNLAQSGATTYTATLSTSPTATAGTYNGTLQLLLCADANCATPFPGSPWNEPYNITITP